MQATRQTKQLLIVSGMALTMMAPTAIAQSGNNDSRRDGVQQDGLDHLGEASRAARQEDQRSTANSILTSLEGIWNVNIQVNRTQWDAMSRSRRGFTDSDRTGLNRDSLDATNPDRGTDRNPRDRDIERDGTERDRQDGTREQDRRDRENVQERGERGDELGTNGSTRSGQMDSADGMARSNAILGGNILQTKVIFGADVATRSTTGRAPDRQDRDAGSDLQRDADRQSQERNGSPTTTTTTGQMDNGNLQSMSFLGYDQNSDEYNLALMTGQNGTIHYFTGKYDRSNRRIVFKSIDSSPVSTRPTDDRSPGSGATTTSGAQMQEMTVVLAMEGSDAYTVTAYSSSSATTGTPDRDTGLGGQPSRGDDRGTNNRDQDRGLGDSQRQDAGSSLPDNIIYKATYTKADRNMRSQHDRLFDDREREERAAPLDELEQERNERRSR